MGEARARDRNATDGRFMRVALDEARAAAAEGEAPIGAAVVFAGEVIARAHNRRERDTDPSAHAEFAAMVEAARVLGRWRLTGCTVYVTLEPCPMCAGLMVNARIDRCVFGAADPKGGALGSLYRLHEDPRLNHAFAVTAGVLEDVCAAELRTFFRRLRDERAHDAAVQGNAACAATDVGSDENMQSGHATRGGAAQVAARRPLRALLAIDSFKGSATSAQAEEWVAAGIRRVDADAQVTCLPIGDGGEGTVDALVAARGGALRTVTVQGPCGTPVEATYLLMDPHADEGDDTPGPGTCEPGARERGAQGPDAQEPNTRDPGTRGPAAYIEMASAAGIGFSPVTREAALAATTYGVGELVLDAVAQGARIIYLGLGGSATNDGGSGFLRALGARLLDATGAEIAPGLAGLEAVASIDLAPAARALAGCSLVALSDVRNPLVGARGALAVFGPQKGLPADADRLRAYDAWMIRYGALLDQACRAVREVPFRSLPGVPGAGAAGGLGAAALALGASLTSGIDAVLDLVGFDEVTRGADVVVTGEGMMDGQTAGGKAPIGVTRRATSAGARVIAVVGGRADDLDAVYDAGVDVVLPIPRRPMALAEALSPQETRANLICAGETVARIMRMR